MFICKLMTSQATIFLSVEPDKAEDICDTVASVKWLLSLEEHAGGTTC